jgi:hypothetical protein
MKNNNPNLPPTPPTKTVYLRDLPRDQRRTLILSGDTTAGPLAVFMYEHPIQSLVIGALLVGALLYGCWTCIQM